MDLLDILRCFSTNRRVMIREWGINGDDDDDRLADTKTRCGRPIKKTRKRLGPLGRVTLNKKKGRPTSPLKGFCAPGWACRSNLFHKKAWSLIYLIFHYLYIIVYITLHTWRRDNPILSCFNVMVWLKWLFSQFDIHRIAIFCIYEIEFKKW